MNGMSSPALSLRVRFATVIARWAGRPLILAAATLTLASGLSPVLLPVDAMAGDYHVLSCAQPDGQPAPTDGWWGSVNGPNMSVVNGCEEGGSLEGLVDEQPKQPAGAEAVWTFTAPAWAKIGGATFWRSYIVDQNVYEYEAAGEGELAAPEDSHMPPGAFDRYTSRLWLGCIIQRCTNPGNPASRFDPTNEVIAPAQNLTNASHIYFDAACRGEAGKFCTSISEYRYLVQAQLRAADITLHAEAPPTASAVGGSLLTAEKLNGPQNLLVTASDPGPGVYETIFEIDGKVVASPVLDSNSGHCQNVEARSDGVPAFLYPQPCPAQVNSIDVPFDPSVIPNGPHDLKVLVSDAAQNTTTILDRQVIIDNGGAYTTLLARGQCNGTTCDDHARLMPTSKLRGNFTRPLGHSSLTLKGSLVDHTGAPINGAQVQLLEQPNEQGAAIKEIASVSSDHDGRWAFHVPAGPWRLLRVAYYSHLKDPTPAARLDYHERVSAAVSLSAPARVHAGRSLVFYGQLAGGYVPRQGEPVQMEILYAGRWRTIEVLHTDRHGRWAYRYVFSIGGGSYLFRAVALANVGYPFLAAGSRPVRITVLG
jgi:hypothetical protein